MQWDTGMIKIKIHVTYVSRVVFNVHLIRDVRSVLWVFIYNLIAIHVSHVIKIVCNVLIMRYVKDAQPDTTQLFILIRQLTLRHINVYYVLINVRYAIVLKYV